ncbi:cutinase family protein [Leucobacter sp. USHLN154]|uniref:cutinase family protein n=1 Tax=Leucobacter sp. USHLN154 TaxID=3081269 RepID=UPI003015B359
MGESHVRGMLRRLSLPGSIVLLGAALAMSGCAAPVDPAATRESLSDVTEDPAPPEAAELYDAELHPEPVVDPVDCDPYLVITARGTGEPSQGQLLSPVARTISQARPGDVGVLDLDYPADTDVKEGGTLGVRTLIDVLNVQADACPAQRFVLLGYSQGALVVGDGLAEPEARMVGATVGTVAEEALERVLAVVFYGDPRFVGAEEYNVGSFDPETDGLLPRPEGALDAVEERVRDYCVAGDFICQSSLDFDEEPHVEYYSNGMQGDGAAFVITRLDDAGAEFREDGGERTPPSTPTPRPRS